MGTGTAVQAGGRGRTAAPEGYARQAERQPPYARSHGMSKGRRPVVASGRRQQQRRYVARPMGGACATIIINLHDIIIICKTIVDLVRDRLINNDRGLNLP